MDVETAGYGETAAYEETTRADATVAEAQAPLTAAEIDDDLSLPAADELFGRRHEFVPNQDVEDFGEGEEFEIDLDAPEPSAAEAAPPVQTPRDSRLRCRR